MFNKKVILCNKLSMIQEHTIYCYNYMLFFVIFNCINKPAKALTIIKVYLLSYIRSGDWTKVS